MRAQKRNGQLAAWTVPEARQILDQLEKSGETIAAFAERNGVTRQRIFYWKKRLGEIPKPAIRKKAATSGPTFVPAVVREPRVAIAIRVGVTTIEIASTSSVPPAWIASLVTALSEPRCS